MARWKKEGVELEESNEADFSYFDQEHAWVEIRYERRGLWRGCQSEGQ